MVVMCSLSWKSCKIYKSVLTRLQKVQDYVCFGVAAKKGEDQDSILDRKKYLDGGLFLDTDDLFYWSLF